MDQVKKRLYFGRSGLAFPRLIKGGWSKCDQRACIGSCLLFTKSRMSKKWNWFIMKLFCICKSQVNCSPTDTSDCSTAPSSLPAFFIASASRSFFTICSGVCRVRFFVTEILLCLNGFRILSYPMEQDQGSIPRIRSYSRRNSVKLQLFL